MLGRSRLGTSSFDLRKYTKRLYSRTFSSYIHEGIIYLEVLQILMAAQRHEKVVGVDGDYVRVSIDYINRSMLCS